MITLVHDDRETTLPDAAPDPDALWLRADQVLQASSWAWKPEGLCRDDACIPLPPDAEGRLRRGDRLDLAAFWRHAGHPVAHDRAGRHWVLGTAAAERHAALAGTQAPDFELPDLAGTPHRLSALRGRKVFLVTWASW
jgi:hypothetical protein